MMRSVVPSWVPVIENEQGPLYWRIVAVLRRDIRSGRLGAGERLPTHRALAEALGITSNTVTKAYAEAERNDLVVSRIGRGTYVIGFPEEMADGTARPPIVMNLNTNDSTGKAFNPIFNRLLGSLSRRGLLHGLLEIHPYPGLDRHRTVGARWIARRGIDATAERVIVCGGAQEALLAILSATTRQCNTVLTEKLNYAGLRRATDLLQINLRGVGIDENGMIPEALEAACENEQIAAILVNPTNHNPTNAFTPVKRRIAIVEIARRAGALLIEDDVSGYLTGHDAPTLAALAPDRCVYVSSMSKSLAAGLRVAYILAPTALVRPITEKLRASSTSYSALMGEFVTLLIEKGHADEILAWHRHEAQARHELALATLGLENRAAVPSYHFWLPLPEPWRTAEFTAELKAQGVLVAPSDQFAVDRSPVPHAVRLALGSISDQEILQKGLNIVAKTLRGRSSKLQDVR